MSPLGTPFLPTDERLVNQVAAAKQLGISPRSLWSETNAGRIPCIKFGRSVRYSVNQLNSFIRAEIARQRSDVVCV